VGAGARDGYVGRSLPLAGKEEAERKQPEGGRLEEYALDVHRVAP